VWPDEPTLALVLFEADASLSGIARRIVLPIMALNKVCRGSSPRLPDWSIALPPRAPVTSVKFWKRLDRALGAHCFWPSRTKRFDTSGI
jgi:hypothetical protein